MKVQNAIVFVAVCGLFTMSCAVAQRTMPGTMSDANVLAVLNTIDKSEIEAAQLAKQKAESTQVRGYAARLVDEHSHMLDKNRQLANRMRVQPDPPHLASSMTSTHQKTVDELRKLSGRDFDRAYIAYQVTMHEEAVNLVKKTASSTENPALKQHLTLATPDLESHLTEAQAIQRQLGGRPERGQTGAVM
jgi:putative membrane protein